MNDPTRAYVVKETAISVVINVLFSAGFMFLAFGRARFISLWGVHGLAVDFIPQTFMIIAMSILVPSLLARSRIQSGRISGALRKSAHPLLRTLGLRTLLMAVGLTIVIGGAAVLLLSFIWPGPSVFWTVFPYKLAYGAIVAAIATPLGLKLALSE